MVVGSWMSTCKLIIVNCQNFTFGFINIRFEMNQKLVTINFTFTTKLYFCCGLINVPCWLLKYRKVLFVWVFNIVKAKWIFNFLVNHLIFSDSFSTKLKVNAIIYRHLFNFYWIVTSDWGLVWGYTALLSISWCYKSLLISGFRGRPVEDNPTNGIYFRSLVAHT